MQSFVFMSPAQSLSKSKIVFLNLKVAYLNVIVLVSYGKVYLGNLPTPTYQLTRYLELSSASLFGLYKLYLLL